MDVKPIKTKKIYEEIVEQIKELFAQGDLKPGDKLLSEREFAERLQVSRASVREALSALEAMGLIEIKPGEGTFIRQKGVSSIIEPLALLLLMEKDQVFELLELRKILEVEAAGLAALRATEEDVERMFEVIKKMEEDLAMGLLGEEADFEFHFAIAEAAHNSLLMRLMNTIADTMRQTLRTSREKLFRTPGNSEILYQQHREIYLAIRAKSPDRAKKEMYQHLVFVEKGLTG